jgi:hypothetical protein
MASLVLFALGATDRFDAWVIEHGKNYSSAAHVAAARRTFLANEKVIAELTAMETGSAEYGHTRFSDLTPANFVSQYLTRMPEEAAGANMPPLPVKEMVDAPDAFDWRSENAVTPVRDQSSCGSCWAFSAVQNVESIAYLAKKDRSGGPTPLSVEQVLECDATDEACCTASRRASHQHRRPRATACLRPHSAPTLRAHALRSRSARPSAAQTAAGCRVRSSTWSARAGWRRRPTTHTTSTATPSASPTRCVRPHDHRRRRR